jgi:hypothetical protein
MNEYDVLDITVAVIFSGVIIGIFRTKIAGFSRYTTSLILLTFTLAVSSLLLVFDGVDASDFVNVILPLLDMRVV